MGTALRIREDLSGSDLRRLARKEANRRVMMLTCSPDFSRPEVEPFAVDALTGL